MKTTQYGWNFKSDTYTEAESLTFYREAGVLTEYYIDMLEDSNGIEVIQFFKLSDDLIVAIGQRDDGDKVTPFMINLIEEN